MGKEWMLNNITTRFQLNFKRNVGAVSEEIRKCSPNDLEEWERYYFSKVKEKSHITALGKKLYIKITEVIPKELEEITEDDCINYIYNLVIKQIYDGYTTEIKTIYEQLEKLLGTKIEPASDEWDRLFNVDFFIKIKEKYIGLQIKPVSFYNPQLYQEKQIQESTHKAFTKKFGGKVFYIFSIKKADRKEIANEKIIKEIKTEMIKLTNN